MSNANDFVIENGVLTKYVGSGGDVVVPEGVTSIGNWAFSGCEGLTSITIPEGATSIGNKAFSWCSGLTSITIPDSVTSIGESAFEDCTSLTSVTIPDDVTSIGDHAFNKCTSLTSVTIPDSVTSIGKEAFCCCTSLTSITIPNSVISIGDWAFCYCTSLTSVTIPDSVTSIGESAFEDCTSLTSVTIPDGVTSIGHAAFRGCTCLTSVTITAGVTSIGKSAFENCTSLTSVTIPDGVTSIGKSAFENCTSLTSVTIPDGVMSIGDRAFEGCTSLTSVTIPDGVTSIGNGAFSWCKSLTSITIPDGVTSIGDWAFWRCTSLTSVTIPASVTSIDSSAFEDCTRLTSITIPDLSVLPAKFRIAAVLSFANDGGAVDDVRYKSSCKYIKSNAARLVTFAIENPSLLALMCRDKLITPKNVELYMADVQKSNNAELIAMMLDYAGTKITVKQKENVEKQKEKEQNKIIDRMLARQNKEGIDGLTFVVTGKLTTFEKRDDLKVFISEHGGKLVSSMSAVVDYLIINDPSSDSAKTQRAKELGIEIITERQFNDKAGREYLIKDSCLKEYYGVGGDLRIPDDVKSIGSEAFRGCTSLTSVTIPDGVTSIYDFAFYNCTSLTSVSIPESVTRIGENAFSGCSSLTVVTIPDLSVLPAKFRIVAVLSFANDGGAVDDVRYKSSCKYIKSNAAKLATIAIESPSLLALMCRDKLITPKNVELYMDAVQKSNNAELIAMMLDYAGTKIT